MKRFAALATCLALHAMAESPADFASGAPLTVSGGDALQRFALPFEAYRDARRDLADVRVFNGRGEAVPIARAAEPEITREAPHMVELPRFAVTGRGAEIASGAQVTVRTDDGTLIAVHGKRAVRQAAPVAWLLDASQVRDPLGALVLDWDARPGSEVVRVTVEASDDLQAWRHAGTASLVRLAEGGHQLEQPRVAILSSKARYYRVTWGGAAFALRGAQGEIVRAVQAPERAVARVQGVAGTKAGEFTYDLGARLPVEAVRVVPAEPNSVATFTLLARDTPGGDWRAVRTAVFYRLTRDGVEVESAPVVTGRTLAREWMVRVDPQSGGIGAAPPALEARWRRDPVVFVARGEAPFRLVFGDPDAKPAWVSVASLVPGYKRGDEAKLAEAGVGAVQSGKVRTSGWPEWAANLGPRKLALWAVLLGAVAVLGFMAWRLTKQTSAPPRERGK
jgi:hypothetical protein